MDSYKAHVLRTTMGMVYERYQAERLCGRLVLEHSSTCRSLLVKWYRYKGTFWHSTAILFAGELIALVAENGTIYDFVNLYGYCQDYASMIKEDLSYFVKNTDRQDNPYISYPGSDE